MSARPARALVWAPDPGARYPRWLVPALEASGARVTLDAGPGRPRGRWDVAYVPPGATRPARAAHVVAVVDERPATPVVVDADAVLAPAEAMRGVALELAPGLPARVVEPFPWQLAPAAAAPGPQRPPLIVCASPLDWQAGHEHALLALRAVRATGIPARMEIRGDGPLRDAVLYTIEDLALTGAATLEPPLDPAALRSRLAAASAFLLPAVSDAVWSEPLEAMSAGVPVVATDMPALRELVATGGLLVPARDPAALASALARVLRDGGLARRLGDAGAARVAATRPGAAQLGTWNVAA